MECISLWAGVDLFCARLNLTYKTIDPQQSQQIVAEMHKKLLTRFVTLAYPENGEEVVREYLENPESEQSIQFDKDWSRAVAMLNIARSKMAIVADERLKKKDATVTRFITVNDDILNSVLQSYVEDNTSDGQASAVTVEIPEVPTSESAEEGGVIEDQESSEGPGASQDTPINTTKYADFDLSSVKDSDTRSISSVIQDMMGESRMHLFGEFINFLHDQVAKGWIDQEVDADGNIIGFSSVEHSSRAILGNINDIMVKYYENRAQGTINASNRKDGTSSKFLYFQEGALPQNVSIDSEGEDEDGNVLYTVYKHNLITDGRMQASGNQQELFIISAPSFDEAVEAIRSDMQGLSVDYFNDNSINEDGTAKELPTDEDQIDNRFSTLSVADKHFDENMKEVLFSYMLSNNYVQILKHFYPQLAKGYKSKYRVGYVANDTTVAAADQDSATIFVHKRTTPRLNVVVEGGKVTSITKNADSPYLKAVDFELIADVITEKGFRRDALGLAEDIKNEFLSHPNEATSPILASIYYRFFSPEDYSVSMLEKGKEVTRTYRSYKGIVDKNSKEAVDLDDYMAWAEKHDEGKAAPFDTSNKNLTKSLSGIITSLNSTVKHESFMSSNGVGRATNTKSYNIISKYKAEMASYPRAIEQAGAVFTNPDALKDLRVIALTSGSNERLFQISVEGTNVKYKVRLNPIINGKFKGGFPFTVLEFPESQLSFSELRSIYSRFPVSPAVLNDSFMVEFSSSSRMLEQPEQQERALEQFLLSTVLMSEMNKATSDILSLITSDTISTYGNPFKYDPVDTMYGYKRALEASLRGMYGEDGKVYAQDHSGNKMAIVTPKNKISESATLAKRMGEPSSIHRGGFLTGSAPEVKIDGFYTKTGIKVGETVKKNQDMTIHEQAQLQIEQAFLQTLANSNFTETMLQFGVFSDKTNIPLVKMQSDEKFFFPVTSNGTGLDTTILRNRMIAGQQTYWNNLAEEIKQGWLVAVRSLPFPVDISSTDTLFDIDAKLRAAQIPYGEFTWTNPTTGEVTTHRGLSASSGLVKNAMIAIGPEGISVIPQHVLNNVALFNDAALATEFVNTNLKMFKRALTDEGYTKISEQSLKVLTEKLPNAGLNAESGKEVLLDAFFFNSNTLGGELLRIHTGGFAQFKLPKASNITVVTNGKIDAKATLNNVKALTITTVNGEVKPLSSATVQEVIDAVGSSKDKSKILYSAILHNKSLSPDVKAKALIFDDMAVTSSTQFIDQVKRNAGMSSTGQHPRLAGAHEPGVLLGRSSKNVTIEDPSFDLTVLGKSGKDGQDIYDAVQIGHPLYFIKLANSLGGEESNYSPTGAPVKDITNEVDAKGFYRFQKKATFDMFSTELTKKGTPELYNMLVKMNSAVRFNTPFMMVPKVDPATGRPVRGDFSTMITEEMWLNGGYGLEMVLDTATGTVVTMESLLRPLREGTEFEKQQAGIALKTRLANGELKTDKVQKQFQDLQHLWEYFGSIDNKNAWNMVANVIGNHSVSPNDMSLDTATFPVRDSYVEKVGFKSQEKTGSKQLLSDTSINDPGYVYGDENFNGWSEVDNTYHCVILQADHNPDTSHGSKATANHNEDPEDPNHIPMITQILSAIVGEGNTMAEVIAVYKAVGISSQIFTKEVDAKIAAIADKIATDSKITKGTAAYNDLVTRATFEYLTGVLKKSLATREAPGIAGDLVSDTYKDQLSFDIKQILPVATSSVNSDFNRNTVRMTFPGGQYIVAPSHDFIKTFTVAGKDGFTRDDINKISINPTHPLYSAVIGDPQFALKPPVMADLVPSDILTISIVNPAYEAMMLGMNLKLGDKIQYSKLRRLIASTNPEDVDSLVEGFVQDNTEYRLGNSRGSSNRLQWTQYRKHNADGTITNIKDTEEYKAFQAVKFLKPGDEIPRNLRRYYYFNGNNEEGAPIREVFTNTELAQADAALANNPDTTADIEFIIKSRTTDPGFIKRFEKPLYNLLQEEGWTSEPAEFYMPSMHKKTFLLRDTDSLYDIIGATDPDYNKLISLGVIKPGTYSKGGKEISLIDNEDIYRQLNTNFSTINTIIGLPSSPYFQQMTPEQQAAWTEFKAAKGAQNKSMIKFFKQRVSKLYESNFNAFRTAPSVAIAIDRMEKQVKNSPSGSEYSKALNLLLTELKESTVTVETTDADILNRVFKQGEFPNGPITQLINKKAAKLASGFTTSLEFITARIPAQGKQSGTIGKIKNFVFSSRNSCYGPLEMLKMTGADYDIDKQNMMTWAFDEDGVLIDWKPFLDANGQISMDKFNTWSEGMTSKEANAYFKSAIQNFIVHNITAVFKSPKNAIEANTPVSMDKTKQAKTEPDLSQAVKSKSVEDILKLREHASPFNPADMFKYEKLNMDGKSGIGIFASDLKGYFATYFATITSDPSSEGEYIKFKSNSGLNITQSEKLGIRQDAVQFFDLKTGELTSESSTIANSGKYVGEGKGISIKAKEGLDKLKNAETEEEQIAILSEYVDAIHASNNANVDEQAWEDLSELLSAATDNAKELILGQINATTATSSIISTMVRMGIDLKYALQLVGHTDPKARPRTVKIGTKTYNDIRDIRGLIRKIDEVGDTQKDGGGFARLLPILETMQPDVPLGAGEKELREYVSDPFRQLFTFAKMTEEFGLLSSLLSINQGLKNSAFEGWKFISGIEARLNDITGGKPAFDFERFIKSASRAVKDGGDGGMYMHDIIKSFDTQRTGINVPFVLSKNSHYFGYYEAMFKAKELVNVVSKVDSTVETIIDNMTAKAPRLKRKVTDKDYKGIQNLIYGIGVEGYLKDVTKLFVIDGKTFDLSIATSPMTSDTSIGGRYEFIQYLPEAVNQAANFGADNHFLSSIPAQDSTVDYITQVRVPILKGPNLHNVTADRFAELKVGLSALKKSNRELYDALFLYSLITNKGSYASGSFIALYDPEKYVDFSGYIKNNADAISAIALNSNNKDIVKYNNPIFIEALSTSKDNIGTYEQAVNNEEQITEDFFDYGSEVGDDFFDNDGEFEEVHRRRTYLDANEKLFHTEGITKGKMSKNGIKDDIIRSKETGLIYKWDKFIKLWIPMVQRIPSLVIPFSGVNQTGMITDTGFDEGWETTLPEVTPSGEPVKAKIISYVDKYFIDRFKKDLSKSLHIASNTNFEGEQYLIKRDNGAYEIVSKQFLLAGSTDGLELSQHRIGKRYSTIKDKLKSDVSHGFFTLNGVLYDRKVEGSVPTNNVTISPSRIGKARNMYGGLNVANIKPVIDGLDAAKQFNMSETALNNQFEALKQQYLSNAVFEQFETFDLDKLNHLYTGRERRAAAAIIKETNDIFDTQSSIVSKLITLYKGKNIIEDRFKSLEGAKLTPETTKDLVAGKAPSIAIEAFKDQTLLDNTSWGQAQQLMRLMGVTNDSFEKLVKDTLLKKGGSLDVYIGGEETKGRPDGSTELVSRVITNKEVKPKGYSPFSMEHEVPNDLRNKFSREASPDVLNSLINVLNDRFPGSNFSRMSTAQIEETFGAHYSRPGVKAFVMNGEVIFNQERMTLDTPIHEYMHIYMQHLKLEDPELYHQLIEHSLEHPLAESMAKTYKDITRFELGEEVFVSLVSAHMMGTASENEHLTALLDLTSKGSTVFGKILDFFKGIFNKAFGVSEDKLDLTLTDSLGSIIDKLGSELAYGKGSMLKDFSNETKQLIAQSRKGAMIDYKQVLDLLTEKGFIKRVCV